MNFLKSNLLISIFPILTLLVCIYTSNHFFWAISFLTLLSLLNFSNEAQNFFKSKKSRKPILITYLRAFFITSIILAYLNQYITNTHLIAISILIFLMLDGLNGFMARKTNSHSDFGERLDTEVNSFAVLIISYTLYVKSHSDVSVLALGLMQYLFSLYKDTFSKQKNRKDSQRESGRFIFIILSFSLSFLLDKILSNILISFSFLLLIYSFSRDFVDLHPKTNEKANLVILFIFLNMTFFLPGYLINADTRSFLPFFPDHHPKGDYGFNLLSIKEYLLHLFVRRYNIDPFRISFEFTLFSLFFLFFKKNLHKKLIFTCGYVFFIIIFGYNFYEALNSHFLNQDPLFLNSFYQISHGLEYLLSFSDISLLLKVLSAFIFFFSLLFILSKTWTKLLNVSETVFNSFYKKSLLFCLIIPWGFLSLFWFGEKRIDPIINLVSYKIYANIDASIKLANFTSKNQKEMRVNYKKLRNTKLFTRKNFFNFVTESYGNLFLSDKKLGSVGKKILNSVETLLVKNKIYSSSSLSRSPVFGGSSWLANSTVLKAYWIDNQITYDYFFSYNKSVWKKFTLIDSLRIQGYKSASIEPGSYDEDPDKKNMLNFSYVLQRKDFQYRGKSYGWGVVPDQYSLNYAWDTLKSKLKRPFFFYFKSVSTHTPFPLVKFKKNWQHAGFSSKETSTDLRLILKKKIINIQNPSIKERFFLSHLYEWEVYLDFLIRNLKKNDIVFIYGDHQPFIADNKDFRVLVHALSKNKEYIEKLDRKYFKAGMVPRQEKTDLNHKDLMIKLLEPLTQYKIVKNPP